MRRTKDEAEKTRQAILVAAEKLFVGKGVAKVSLDQIAKSLDLTRGAVRWHFHDKRGLLLAILDSRGLPLHELASHLQFYQKLDPLDELISVTERLLGDLQSDPKRRQLTKQLLNFLDVDAPEQRRAFDKKIRTAILAVFDHAAKRGGLTPQWPPDKAAFAFYAMVSGFVSEWLRGGANFDLRTDVISTINIFMDSIRSKKHVRARRDGDPRMRVQS